ncbi:12245_t:CDS:2, partial [Gigaspora rosea]
IDTWSWLSNFDKELIFLGKKDLEVRNKFLTADKIIPTLSFTPQCHPNAIYTSRLINTENLSNTYKSIDSTDLRDSSQMKFMIPNDDSSYLESLKCLTRSNSLRKCS